MRIGLCDIDSHNWPNLCLMKLSAYHKARGDHVEWWRPEGRYDRVYKSRVFTDTYSQDTITVTNAGEVVCGGTGYDPYVMVYDRPSAPAITRQLQRWVNNKRIFHTVPSFAGYIPGRMGGVRHA